MNTQTAHAEHAPFAGGGEMGVLMRALDWAQTAIGPVASWSPALQMIVRLLLANRFQLILWWGPEFCQLYNDAYRPILGAKHPQSMGQPARECWPEIWHIIGPLIEKPFHGGEATWMEDILLEINRFGFTEETHYTIAYSPVPDDTVPGGIGGVLGTIHEITEKVVGEHRVVALRDLGAHSAEAKTAGDACAIAAETLAQHPEDVPFALFYLLDEDRQRARSAGIAGVTAGETASPVVIELDDTPSRARPWPLAEVVRAEALQLVDELPARLGKEHVPPGPW